MSTGAIHVTFCVGKGMCMQAHCPLSHMAGDSLSVRRDESWLRTHGSGVFFRADNVITQLARSGHHESENGNTSNLEQTRVHNLRQIAGAQPPGSDACFKILVSDPHHPVVSLFLQVLHRSLTLFASLVHTSCELLFSVSSLHPPERAFV